MLRRFRSPDSRLLRILFGFLMAGLGTKLGLVLFQKRDTLSDGVGNFFVELVVPYCYGAFGSDFLLVWLGAAVASVAFGFAVCSAGTGAASIAKRSLLVLLVLSLFTIWIEPFVSFSAAIGGTLMTLAKIPMKFVDIGVSVMWPLVYWRAVIEIDNKVAARDDRAPSKLRESSESIRGGDRLQPIAATVAGLPKQGAIVLKRPWSTNQCLYGVTVLVDRVRVGKLRNGKTITLQVPAGKHEVTVKYFVFTTTIEVMVNPGENTTIEQTFGTWVASPKLKIA